MEDLRNQNQNLLVKLGSEATRISELLNRIQAGDLGTFSAMQYHVNPEPTSDFAPRTDAGEQGQLVDLYNKHGLGDVIYSESIDYDPLEELKEYL